MRIYIGEIFCLDDTLDNFSELAEQWSPVERKKEKAPVAEEKTKTGEDPERGAQLATKLLPVFTQTAVTSLTAYVR